MRRKVSLWIVIALVGALAATTAAAVVLAQRDDRPDAPGADGRATAGWPHPGLEESGPWQGPVMGAVAGWEREDETPVLPWVLFALASGTAVGLLIAWSPWRMTPAPATTSPTVGGEDVTAAVLGARTATPMAEVTAATPAQATTATEPATDAAAATEVTMDLATEETTDAAEAVAPEAEAVKPEAGATEEAPPQS
jgi:hypothetical protein